MGQATELIEAEMPTELVASPLEYAVLLPPAEARGEEPLPLVYFLHGGEQDRSLLANLREVFAQAWSRGTLPPAAIVTPSASRALYLDTRDGAERWETLLTSEFLSHLRSRYGLAEDRAGTAACGISMGGLGVLNLGLKHPDKFVAVAALEPGIMPALTFEAIPPRNTFFRGRRLLEQLHGRPIDPEHWAANNPASLAVARAESLRTAAPAIYLDCGDADTLHLDEGAEFLHRVLRDQGIRHEYHLVLGADHVGDSLRPRLAEALAFLGRALRPAPPDERAAEFRRQMERLKRIQGVD